MNRGRYLIGAETPVARPDLPTYATVADVLEKKNGSGIRLAGWTVARVAMIAPPMMVVGVPVRQAIGGSALASVLISIFTMLRISSARDEAVQAPTIARGRFEALR
jgi:hypothetical protein